MRRCWIVNLLVSLSLVSPATAQDVVLAARGPRFLRSGPAGAPVEIEASAAPTLRRVVSLTLEQPTVSALLGAIERQTGLEFVYSRAILDVERVVNLRADRIPLAAALTAILQDAGVDVLLTSGRRVVLVRRREAPAEPQAGGIVGRVKDAKTGAGLSGATIVLEGTRLGATAGPDGKFRVADVPPGNYTARARYIGYAPLSQAATVNEGQDVTLDFALTKSAQQLDEVVTTGTVVPTEVKAIPTPITVITAEQIEAQHPQRLDDLLRFTVPGAAVAQPDATSNPAIQSISFRGGSSLGYGGSNPKLYIDGIEVSDEFRQSVDPSTVERMEIVRGPQAAALYGSDALGGVIQIFTKRGGDARSRADASLRAAVGTIESGFRQSGALRQEYDADVSGRNGPASYHVGAGYTRDGEWMPQYGLSDPHVNGGIQIAGGSLTLDVSARIEQQNISQGFNSNLIATGSPFIDTIPSYQRIKERYETYGVRLDYRPFAWLEHAITAGVDQHGESAPQWRPRFAYPGDTLLSFSRADVRKTSVAYHATAGIPLGTRLAGTVTVGVDHSTLSDGGFYAFGATSTDPLRLAPDAFTGGWNGHTTNTGIFAQAQFSVQQALFLTGAVRAEDNSSFGSAYNWPVSPRVGVSYVRQLGAAALKLRASYGRAIRPPDPGAKDTASGPGYVQLSNPLLRPTQQRGPDAGVDLIVGDRGSLSVTYYHQHATDFIYPSETVDSTGLYISQYHNVASVRNTGWEFEGTLHASWATVRGQFAITQSRPTDLGLVPSSIVLRVGQQLQGIPVHTAGVTVTATPLRHTGITAGIAYQGSVDGYDVLAFHRCLGGVGPCRGTSFTDYYGALSAITKINLSAEQQVGRMMWGYVSVQDLTNTRFLPKETRELSWDHGRTAMVGVRARF